MGRVPAQQVRGLNLYGRHQPVQRPHNTGVQRQLLRSAGSLFCFTEFIHFLCMYIIAFLNHEGEIPRSWSALDLDLNNE